ncbi:MAG: D-alanyl-D-alanine carboxypeptidase/D-alanyl-D-alanine-endopeptidase [Solirubrobacterales bacterium]
MRRAATLLACACAALLVLAASAQASRSCDRMRSLLGQGASASGLLVVDAENGQVVCSEAANGRRSLASNTKLFTTAAALARLGPQARIPTKLYANGRIDAAGTLHGSLFLVGGGDPTLGSPAFIKNYLGGLGTNVYALQAKVRAAGIKRVTGRLWADDTIFDRRRGVLDSGYATSYYIGPLSGLSFNAGFAGNSAYSGFSSDPAKLAASKLARSLRAGGVGVARRVGLKKTPRTATRIGVIRSPQLTKLVNLTNVYSNNFFAETFAKLLGARYAKAGTTKAGVGVIHRFARSKGSGTQTVDGSGLTRSNRASPRQVVDLLLGMRRDPAGDEFIQDLPLTGVEGTVDDRMKGTAAYRRCRAKTGTITGVSALSGYCFNKSGRVMAFSILMNGVYDLSQAHLSQDRIAATVASY